MRKITLSMIAILTSSWLMAQTPELFNYQGVARDVSGNVLANQSIGLQFTIHETTATGVTVYQETHTSTTNQFGLFALKIGSGTPVSGTLAGIDWSGDIHFFEVELDETGGTSYQTMGTSQLISVPYALHAKTVENDMVDDADADATNEIQLLSMNLDTLFISSSNYVILPSGSVNTDDQNLTFSNDTLYIQDGNNVYLGGYTIDNVNDGDTNSTNEIQMLSKSGSTVTLSNNGGFFTDDINDADSDTTNELQSISKSGNTVTLSNGGGTFTDAVDDADASTTNEIQTLSISNDTIFLTNGGFTVLPEGATLWGKNGNNISNTNNGNVGIGTSTPIADFHVVDTTSNAVIIVDGKAGFTGYNVFNDGTEKWFIGLNGTNGDNGLIFRRNAAVNDITIDTMGGVTLNGNLGVNTLSKSNFAITMQASNQNGLQGFRDTTGNLQWHTRLQGTGDADLGFTESGVLDNRLVLKAGGNIGVGTANPSEKLDVAGKTKSSQGFYSISGSIVINGTGTFVIDYGNLHRGIGMISCSIDQIPNGIWNSGGTIAFSENSNTKDNLSNIVEYQFIANRIQAQLRPYQGSNTTNSGANLGGKVEVVVSSLIGGPSVLRWSLTIFPAN